MFLNRKKQRALIAVRSFNKAEFSGHPRGVALVLVLFAVSTAFILALSFMNAQATNAGIARNVQNQSNARHIAESAIEIAIEHIRGNSDFRDSLTSGEWATNHPLAGGTFTIFGEDGVDANGDGIVDGDGDLSDDPSDLITLTVVANYNGATHRVRAIVRPGNVTPPVKLLLVVADSESESPQDTELTGILEGLGYSVTVIDDDANSSEFNAALSEHAVVYVGHEANASAIGSKLSYATIGVVTSIQDMYDDLGLSSGNATFNGDSIKIVNNTHYITNPFSLGSLTITSASAALTNQSGSVAPGGNPLGVTEPGSARALTAIDLGASMYNLDPSAGRRVALPWGDFGFQIGQLNADGLTILERSLRWASAPTTITSRQIGLAAREDVDIQEDAIVDSFDSRQGSYGGDNVGQDAVIVTNSTSSSKIRVRDDAILKGSAYAGPGGNPSTVISVSGNGLITGAKSTIDEMVQVPDPKVPSGMPSSEGNVTFKNSVIETFDSNRRFNELVIKDNAIVQVSGAVTILCDTYMSIEDNAEVRLLAGASLTIYVNGKIGSDAVHLEGNAKLNVNTGDPSRCTVYVLSSGEFDFDGAASGYARLVSQDGELDVNDDCEFFGTFLCKHITIEQRGKLHHDIGISPFPDDNGVPEAEVITEGPQLVALYEFNEVKRPSANLLFHWKLDDSQGGSSSGSSESCGDDDDDDDDDGGSGSSATGNFSFGLAANEKIELKDDSFVDSYRSSAGPYSASNLSSQAMVATNSTSSDKFKLKDDSQVRGNAFVGSGGNPKSVIDEDGGTITGAKTALEANVDMTSPSKPTGMPSNQGNLKLESGNTTISSDKTYDKLEIKNSATLTISGHVRIFCDKEFKMEDDAQVIIPAGSSLELYVDDKVEIKDDAIFNADTSGTSRAMIAITKSDKEFKFSKNAKIAAKLEGGKKLELKDDAQVFGIARILKEIKIEKDAQFHIDLDLVTFGADIAVDEIVGNNGTHHDVTLGVGGHDGNAAEYNGTDSYTEVPHHAFMLRDEGSISLWFKPTDVAGHQALFSKDASGRGNGGQFEIFLKGSTLSARLESTTAEVAATSSTPVVANTWHHAVVTWGPHGLRVFLNATLEDTEEYSGGTGTSSGGSGNTEPIALGASTRTSNNGTVTTLSDYFEGVIDDVRMYDMALSPSQVSNLMAGAELGDNDDPGLAVTDTSNFGVAADMTISDAFGVSWSNDGLTLAQDNRIISEAAASKIHTALTATNEMSVEFTLSTDDISQFGPANIVTYSSGVSNRNFSVGQADTTFVGRVRTTDTVSNGTPDVTTPSASLIASTQTHVIMSYDRENVTIFVDGVAKVTTARTGDFNDWSSAMKLMLANEFGADRPWRGTLRRVAIWDTGFNGIQAKNVFNGNEPGNGLSNSAFRVTWVEIP